MRKLETLAIRRDYASVAEAEEAVSEEAVAETVTAEDYGFEPEVKKEKRIKKVQLNQKQNRR